MHVINLLSHIHCCGESIVSAGEAACYSSWCPWSQLYSTNLYVDRKQLSTLIESSQASSALGTVMACDEVDPSLILTEQCKWKVSSYATNEDNYSADKAETVKQLQKTTGSTEN